MPRVASLAMLSSSLLPLVSSHLLDRVTAVAADEPGHRDSIRGARDSRRRREFGKRVFDVFFEMSGVVEKRRKMALCRLPFFPFSLQLLTGKKKRKTTRFALFFTPEEAREKSNQPWCSSPMSSGPSAKTSCS